MLRQYIRTENRNPIGLLEADLSDNGLLRIGYSVANQNAGDTFNKDLANRIVSGRRKSNNAIVVDIRDEWSVRGGRKQIPEIGRQTYDDIVRRSRNRLSI